MYLFYEHHKDAVGIVQATELKLSSSATSWYINWRKLSEKAQFDIVNVLLKQPPVASRMYEPKTSVWSYIGTCGVDIIAKIEESLKPLGGITLVEVEDLQWLAQQAHFDTSKKRVQIDPKNFFYNTAPIAQAGLTTKQLRASLAALLEVENAVLVGAQNGELKKLYRQAALRLHPDRNNGDSSKMSELNMLWRMYNG